MSDQITQEYVKSLFDYKDGELYRKVSRNTKHPVGSLAGSFNIIHQRFQVQIDGRVYKVAQIVFLWHKGFIPIIIDHENLDKTDDRIENLRESTKSKNGHNSHSRPNSTSNYRGVCLHKSGRWQATITINRKQKHLGLYLKEEDAAAAYNKAAIEYFKEFANLNIIS